MSTGIDENACLLRLASGERAAFDELYVNFSESLLKQCLRITKSMDVAEDIVQDAFIYLWEKRQQFAGYKKISGWLFLTTYNASISFLRKTSREEARHHFFEFNKHTNEDFAIKEAKYELMEKAVNELSEQRRKVLILCKYQGFTYEQTALELGISKNTVKDHISKATAFIKDYIDHNNQSLSLLTLVLLSEKV